MKYETTRAIEERWRYEHSPAYLQEVAIKKMKAQRARDGPPLSEIVDKFIHEYN